MLVHDKFCMVSLLKSGKTLSLSRPPNQEFEVSPDVPASLLPGDFLLSSYHCPNPDDDIVERFFVRLDFGTL